MNQGWGVCFRVLGFLSVGLLYFFFLGVGSLEGNAKEKLDREKLKAEVDSFFGAGEFEKFLEKHILKGNTEEEALGEMESFLHYRALDKWQDMAWRDGTEEPPEWWEPWMRAQPDEDFYYHKAQGCSIGGEYIHSEESPEFKKDALAFLQKLQQAIRTHDKVAFSELVAVPMNWYFNRDDSITLQTPEDVIQNFDRLLYPEMRQELLNLKLEDIEVFYRDFFTYIMVDDGVLWLQCDLRIYQALPPRDVWVSSARSDAQNQE